MTVWDYHWKQQQKAGTKIPNTVQTTLRATDPILYPNILRAMCVLGVLPITTCECERSVSALRRLKTYLRSTMSQTRLTGLALMHVHRDIQCDTEKLVTALASKHPRRMEFCDLIQDK